MVQFWSTTLLIIQVFDETVRRLDLNSHKTDLFLVSAQIVSEIVHVNLRSCSHCVSLLDGRLSLSSLFFDLPSQSLECLPELVSLVDSRIVLGCITSCAT